MFAIILPVSVCSIGVVVHTGRVLRMEWGIGMGIGMIGRLGSNNRRGEGGLSVCSANPREKKPKSLNKRTNEYALGSRKSASFFSSLFFALC